MRNSDTFFVKGVTHDVCQDYAAHGKTPKCDYAIVSDGCSTAKDSDVGARIMAKSAESLIGNNISHNNISQFIAGVIIRAKNTANYMKLAPEALNATLLIAKANDTMLQSVIFGDGVLFARRHDGGLVAHHHKFKPEAPFYPCYNMDFDGIARYLESFDAEFEVDHVRMEPNGTLFETTQKGSFADSFKIYNYSTKMYNLVGVISDGAVSFLDNQTKEPVEYLSIIDQLAAFKNYNGQFVERRMKRAMKDFSDAKWEPQDDLAMGVVYSQPDTILP